MDSGRRPLPSLDSSDPTRPLPKNAPGSGSSSSAQAPVINLASNLKLAKVHPNGSRLAAVAPHSNLSTMGWGIFLASNYWNAFADKDVKAFASPYPTVSTYSDSRLIWMSMGFARSFPCFVVEPQSACVLLACLLLSRSFFMRVPSSFPAQDREQIVARLDPR